MDKGSWHDDDDSDGDDDFAKDKFYTVHYCGFRVEIFMKIQPRNCGTKLIDRKSFVV